MQKLEISATKTTFGINFDPFSHVLAFSGMSYPSNPITFFQPVLKWIEDYLLFFEKEKITLKFNVSYFNTSSSTYLFQIFDMFDRVNSRHSNVEILFFYSDDEDDILDSWKSLLSDFDFDYKTRKLTNNQ